MALSFRGEFDQKVDSKGRCSIPADFRRVLESGDPDHPANPNPRLVLLYGPHLKDHLQVYTIEGMREIEQTILAMPRSSSKRKALQKSILSKSWETEVDRDGRIVLPKDRREQIGLEGEAKMVAMGDHFEIWNKSTHTASEEEAFAAFEEEFGEDFDPMDLLDG